MNTKTAVDNLIQFAEENEIEKILVNKPVLERFGREYGAREIKNISTAEFAAFFRNVADKRYDAPGALAQWDRRYRSRFEEGSIFELPWELTAPLQELKNLFKKKSFRPQKALELGCGDGMNATFMASKGAQVTAVDISPSAIKIAKQRAKNEKVKCRFLATDIFSLSRDEKFDFIFDRGCFHHVPVVFYEEYIDLVRSLLKPGGKFLLIAHSSNTFIERAQDLYLGMFSRFLKYICDGQSETGFSKSEIKELFGHAFEIKSMNIIEDDHPGRALEFHRNLKFISTLCELKKEI